MLCAFLYFEIMKSPNQPGFEPSTSSTKKNYTSTQLKSLDSVGTWWSKYTLVKTFESLHGQNVYGPCEFENQWFFLGILQNLAKPKKRIKNLAYNKIVPLCVFCFQSSSGNEKGRFNFSCNFSCSLACVLGAYAFTAPCVYDLNSWL